MLFNKWIKNDKNNELNLNINNILDFVKKSVYVVQKS